MTSRIISSLKERSIDVSLFLLNKVYSHQSNLIPIRYFDAVSNVGDLLNPFLIQKITGYKVTKCNSSLSRHILGIGSIGHLAGRGSLIWGSGLISPEVIPPVRRLSKKKIYALRGHKTFKVFESLGIIDAPMPLGDPALLLNTAIDSQSITKKHRVGLCSHYKYYDCEFTRSAQANDIFLLDVTKSPECFIHDLQSCEYVVSSSLHGLILSDVYGIPNTWISHEQQLFGGNFKFLDYYSTTDSPDQASTVVPMDFKLSRDNLKILIKKSSVKKFIGSLSALGDSLHEAVRSMQLSLQ